MTRHDSTNANTFLASKNLSDAPTHATGVEASEDPSPTTTSDSTTRRPLPSSEAVKRDGSEEYNVTEATIEELQLKSVRSSTKRKVESVDEDTREIVEAFNGKRIKRGSLREVTEMPMDILFEVSQH